jgi:hypothetical protein
MGHNVDVVMQKAFDVNLIIRTRLKVQYSPHLILKLNEYMKVIEIAMVQVLDLMEDERTFNKLAFKKSMLHSQLATHIDLCV